MKGGKFVDKLVDGHLLVGGEEGNTPAWNYLSDV
jgi:hypothetical protein